MEGIVAPSVLYSSESEGGGLEFYGNERSRYVGREILKNSSENECHSWLL